MASDSPAAGAAPPAGAGAVTAFAVLGDESRRRLLEFVRRARRPVTREEASAAVGISRKLAAFHLDKLVASGLLQSHQGGYGTRRVGRRPKVYVPAPGTLTVTLPPRRHELLASLLAEAVTDQRPGESARDAALRVARERGQALGSQARGGEYRTVLASLGFDPVDADGERTVLRNCPFHPVSAQAPDLVCAMNHAFLRGYLAAAGEDPITVVQASQPGTCCVELLLGNR